MNLENKQGIFVNQLSIEGCMHSWGSCCSHMVKVAFPDGTIQRDELEGNEILRLIKSVAHENIHFQSYNSSFANKDYFTHFSHRDSNLGECQKDLEVFGKKIVPKNNEHYEKLKTDGAPNALTIYTEMSDRDEKFVSTAFNCCKQTLNRIKQQKEQLLSTSSEKIFEFSLDLETPLLRAYFLIFRNDILYGQTDCYTSMLRKVVSLSEEIISEVNFILTSRDEVLDITTHEDMNYYIKEMSGEVWDELLEIYPKPKDFPGQLIDTYQDAVTKFLG